MPSPELLAKTVDGILFSAPMILALLAGRKTVTRRTSKRWLKRKPGDLLFVKENWSLCSWNCDTGGCELQYEADAASRRWERVPDEQWLMREVIRIQDFQRGDRRLTPVPLRPSMFLPRWASRLVLRITEPPRLESLHEIDDEDAKREGVTLPPSGLPPCPCEDETLEDPGPEHLPYCLFRQPHVDPHESGPYLAAYVCTWEELRPKKGERWEDNPEVVRIAFEIARDDRRAALEAEQGGKERA